MISKTQPTKAVDSRKLPPQKTNSRKLHPMLWSILLLIGFMLSVGGLAGAAFADLWFNKGVTYGATLPKIPYTKASDLGANPIGVNTFLQHEKDTTNITRILDELKAAGVGFIRQQFAWDEIEFQGRGDFRREDGADGWALFDYIVEQANARGIQVIARIDRPPTWSRLKVLDTLIPAEKASVTGPPDDYAEFGRFVEVTVSRYKGKVKYFQLWNEPNLHVEWNAKKVDPVAYTRLLQIGYEAAKRASPQVVIIAAALSPTNEEGFDEKGYEYRNLNELKFLDGMYKAGAKAFFDIMAAQIYGLGYAPEFRYTEPDFREKGLKRVNYSRTVDLHAVMEKWGDGSKPVWATEYGWVSLPPNLLQNTQWGDSVSEQTQADYLIGGIERARREWDWMGVMNIWFFRSDDDLASQPDDSQKGNQKGFALVKRDFTPRPAFEALKKYLAGDAKVAGIGFTTINKALKTGETLQFAFKGQRLDLDLQAVNPINITVKIDGNPIKLPQISTGQTTLKLAEGLSDSTHQAEISITSGEANLNGFYVGWFNQFAWLFALGYVVFGAGTIVTAAGLAVRLLGWLERLYSWLGRWLRRGILVAWQGLKWLWREREMVVPYFMIFALLVYYFAPPFGLAVAGLLLFLPLAYIRPDWAIMLAVFTAPLYLEPRNLRSSDSPLTILRGLVERPDPTAQRGAVLEFALAEVIIVCATAMWVLREVVRWWQQRQTPRPVTQSVSEGSKRFFATTRVCTLRMTILVWVKRQGVFFLPLLIFFIFATLSLLNPEPAYLKEALREFRLVIVEPILLYLLVVRFIKNTEQVQRIFNILVVSGVLIALVGLYQFLFTKENTVTAEGVSRVISIYNHPDNLGLYLGRLIPLAAAIAFFSTGWNVTRWLYLAATGVMVAALGLSFSRGAWIAVAIALFVMVLVARSKCGLILFGIGAVLGAAALPFIKLERITSLFSLGAGSSGTRLNLWGSAIEMIKDYPLTGIGLDQFLYKYQIEYVVPEAWLERFTSHPHNLILDFWLRLGIIGSVIIAWLLWVYFRLALRLLKHYKLGGADRHLYILGLGLLGSMTDFLVHGMVDNSYFVIDLAMVFCLSCALLEVLRRASTAKPVAVTLK